MSNRRGGLGRGLGALIPTAAPDAPRGPVVLGESEPGEPGEGVAQRPHLVDQPEIVDEEPAQANLVEVPGALFAEVPVGLVDPNPRQPRTAFDEEGLDELVRSIREVGLLQPFVGRNAPGGRYELVMGERRWRAARTAGLARIPAIVRDTADDALLRDALLENLHRSQLNPLEEAAAYDQLLQDFGCTHDELARRIGRSRPQISNTVRLLRLPAGVQRRVAAGVLSAGHARALLGLDDPAEQERLAHRIVAEGLSVRAVEELVAVGVEAPKRSKTPRSRTQRITAPALRQLSERLSDRFETRVRVDVGRTKGKVVVEFASVDDLDRIVALLLPGSQDA
jgi:ParB family transcriptional regulator, chromosome partitioning protein